MVMTSNLEVKSRESVGKGKSRALRREGRIPGIIYGNKNNPISISISERELKSELRRAGFFNRLCDLKLGEEKIRVLPQEISIHPVSEKTEHIDFLRVSENTKVTIQIPVKFINEDDCPGIKLGGILNVVRYTIEVSCPASKIPEEFIIDLTGLELGDSIHFSSIKLEDEITPTIADRDFTVASIVAPAALTSEEEKTEEDEEAEGEGVGEGEGENETEGDKSSEETKESGEKNTKEESEGDKNKD